LLYSRLTAGPFDFNIFESTGERRDRYPQAGYTMSTYLFSIDFEDIRFGLADGLKYQARVPANVHRYLEWLNGRGFKCTFFVVGDAAEAYPSLVREIASEGHEIACHTNRHVSLDRQSKDEFRTELEANVEALLRAGAPRPAGFRAPNFSIVPATAWAYDVLGEMGFVYSSSVLPAPIRPAMPRISPFLSEKLTSAMVLLISGS